MRWAASSSARNRNKNCSDRRQTKIAAIGYLRIFYFVLLPPKFQSTGLRLKNTSNTGLYVIHKVPWPLNFRICMTSSPLNSVAALASLFLFFRLPTSSSLRLPDRWFRYASPFLPVSFKVFSTSDYLKMWVEIFMFERFKTVMKLWKIFKAIFYNFCSNITHCLFCKL